jgi:hypothetical protein
MYDYREAIKADIRQYIEDNETWLGLEDLDKDELFETLNENLWKADSVTGNASGSYTFSSYEAKKNLEGNEDLVREMCEEFCIPAETIAEKFLDEEYEYFDVSVRCYLLGECLGEVIEELENEGHFEEVNA